MSINNKNIGVIFDMDGTMLDNMEVHHQAWHKQLNDHGIKISIEEVREKIHGKNGEIIKKLYGKDLSDAKISQLGNDKEQAYRNLYKDDIKLISGLETFVMALKKANIKISIGTAAPIENVDFVLDGLKIRHWFDAMVHAGMVHEGKPHPEVFLKAAQMMNIEPINCLVFEDSPTGAMAAEKAKMKMIIIGDDYAKEKFKNIIGIQQFLKNYESLTAEKTEQLLG